MIWLEKLFKPNLTFHSKFVLILPMKINKKLSVIFVLKFQTKIQLILPELPPVWLTLDFVLLVVLCMLDLTSCKKELNVPLLVKPLLMLLNQLKVKKEPKNLTTPLLEKKKPIWLEKMSTVKMKPLMKPKKKKLDQLMEKKKKLLLKNPPLLKETEEEW